MNYIDIVLIVIFVVAVFYGLKTGFIAMLMAWVGLVASLLLFLRFGPMIRAGIMANYNIGSFFAGVLSYIIIFVMVGFLVKLLTILFEYVAGLMQLSLLNRITGAVFCFLNVLVVLMLLLYFINTVPFFTKARIGLTDNSVVLNECFKLMEKIRLDYKDRLPAGFLQR